MFGWVLHLRVALLLHGDQGGQGVGEAEQLRLRDHHLDDDVHDAPGDYDDCVDGDQSNGMTMMNVMCEKEDEET